MMPQRKRLTTATTTTTTTTTKKDQKIPLPPTSRKLSAHHSEEPPSPDHLTESRTASVASPRGAKMGLNLANAGNGPADTHGDVTPVQRALQIGTASKPIATTAVIPAANPTAIGGNDGGVGSGPVDRLRHAHGKEGDQEGTRGPEGADRNLAERPQASLRQNRCQFQNLQLWRACVS